MSDKKRILIVDDERDMVDMLKVRLEAADYVVDVAYDGQQGLTKARAEKPDLIILDIMMPVLDGYHMCRLLKFDMEYRNIPIVILTARGREQDRTTAEDVGGDAYIVKPFEGEELLATIKDLLEEER